MKRPAQKFYIASGLDNFGLVRQVAETLKAAGWTHTYDWTKHGSVAGLGEQAFVDCAKNEVEGVIAADVVIALLPGGRGTHVELGIALGLSDAFVNPRTNPSRSCASTARRPRSILEQP
jgi:nucleoside 2-deoxyribosyltransferase